MKIMADVQDRIIAQLDRLENRHEATSKAIFEKLDKISDAQVEKPLHESPCKFLVAHETSHVKAQDRWWSGFLKPLFAGVAGALGTWVAVKFGIKG
jgi:hypothetical protein